MRTASAGAAAVSILRFCRARNGIVQERILALRYIKAAALHIVACRRLEAHCLELRFHPADYKHRKADAHQIEITIQTIERGPLGRLLLS